MERSTLVIVLSFSWSLAAAFPLPEGVRKLHVQVRADQLLYKLDNIPAPGNPTTPSPCRRFSCIIAGLTRSRSRMSDALNGAPQVKTEISSLIGYLDDWRHDLNIPECSEMNQVEELPSPNRFSYKVTITLMGRVKMYVQQLLDILDEVERC